MIILYTKNGTKYSNAILYGGEESMCENIGYIYFVESDFGNKMRLTLKEINERYTLGPVREYREWFKDRDAAINRSARHEFSDIIDTAVIERYT